MAEGDCTVLGTRLNQSAFRVSFLFFSLFPTSDNICAPFSGDSIDQVIPTDREVFISWALGPINADGRTAKHVSAPRGRFHTVQIERVIVTLRGRVTYWPQVVSFRLRNWHHVGSLGRFHKDSPNF